MKATVTVTFDVEINEEWYPGADDVKKAYEEQIQSDDGFDVLLHELENNELKISVQ